ncbi:MULTISPECIES: YheV family putative zinc ribbon protein [Vibrio]|uniref:YheV family putative zinc ribbon protein n=1 Tax=Vibrio TaxID=662 RepID=UPI000C162BB3|nr:YheV family putative zinc ribbon protein [Vibrio fujianensis]NAW67872.1 YheV family putative metal-binding protein [Vibrio sp. V28_P6S34P95]NAX05760.1 YheV family putative metal-binding protein [Vibrio sp. V30_P3S12P165]NAX35162.1 YheV family putative metal-binding protein [Vibrio sp. V29_P1S30P107]NAX36635.1 YheV family putative metal-binding protein [Vibrio sp. V27_P1S3P104]NAX40167.1 YheV family putative metal-binding protein [Vibrio sp. V26_P1S5P106]NNN45669.1 YheV family putative meta
MKEKKRFIAGANCPQCQMQDTLRWWIENNIEWVECVECHYIEQRKPQSVTKTVHADGQMIGIFKPE